MEPSHQDELPRTLRDPTESAQSYQQLGTAPTGISISLIRQLALRLSGGSIEDFRGFGDIYDPLGCQGQNQL